MPIIAILSVALGTAFIFGVRAYLFLMSDWALQEQVGYVMERMVIDLRYAEEARIEGGCLKIRCREVGGPLQSVVYERTNETVPRIRRDSQPLTGQSTLGKIGMEEFEVPEDIDPKVFWAAGKLCALRLEDMPSVMVDTDLIIWKSLGRHLRDKSVAVIHREELNPAIYPDPGSFPMKRGYSYPAGWDFNIRPANTAMLYIRDKEFRDYYVKESLRFMQNLGPSEDNLCPMVFAEQRILPMCAAARGLSIHAFCPEMEGLREQDMFTHLWGHKNVFKFNMDERRGFIRRCMERMRREFPEMYERAAALPELKEAAV